MDRKATNIVVVEVGLAEGRDGLRLRHHFAADLVLLRISHLMSGYGATVSLLLRGVRNRLVVLRELLGRDSGADLALAGQVILIGRHLRDFLGKSALVFHNLGLGGVRRFVLLLVY